MKIAIASSGRDLDSLIDPRFGRCPYFLIVDSKNDKLEVIENEAGQTFRGAGVSAAQVVVNKGVKAVIAGNFGPNAVSVLNNSGVKIYGGISGITVGEIVKQYRAGELKETTAVTTPSGMGRGGGWGRGRQ
jgi:predicted Fe-Mo cluster-binding NifX family protein